MVAMASQVPTDQAALHSPATIAARAHTVVLVAGLSDKLAVRALAERRGRDLDADGVAILAMGGSKNIRRFLGTYSGRKIECAPLLVRALDLDRVPPPLDRLLAQL